MDINEESLAEITKTLAFQAAKKVQNEKVAKTKEILKLIAGGLFLAASFAAPNLPKALIPLFNSNENKAWKRFNIPRLKRTIKSLEAQKLIDVTEENGFQIIKLSKNGQTKILKFCINELDLQKPDQWDGTWRIVMYDIPSKLTVKRQIFKSYLDKWNFYPLQESVLLQAYPCEDHINYLRNYLDIKEYVRFIKTKNIENSEEFKQFFNV